MTSLEYVTEIFSIAAQQLGCPYVKIDISRLQAWTIDNNNNTFISLISTTETAEASNTQADRITFELEFLVVVETPRLQPDDNNYPYEVEIYQQEATELAKRFIRFVNRNKLITVNNYSFLEEVRNPNYLGMGKRLNMNISISDVQGYCDDFDNVQTLNPNIL